MTRIRLVSHTLVRAGPEFRIHGAREQCERVNQGQDSIHIYRAAGIGRLEAAWTGRRGRRACHRLQRRSRPEVRTFAHYARASRWPEMVCSNSFRSDERRSRNAVIRPSCIGKCVARRARLNTMEDGPDQGANLGRAAPRGAARWRSTADPFRPRAREPRGAARAIHQHQLVPSAAKKFTGGYAHCPRERARSDSMARTGAPLEHGLGGAWPRTPYGPEPRPGQGKPGRLLRGRPHRDPSVHRPYQVPNHVGGLGTIAATEGRETAGEEQASVHHICPMTPTKIRGLYMPIRALLGAAEKTCTFNQGRQRPGPISGGETGIGHARASVNGHIRPRPGRAESGEDPLPSPRARAQ